MNVQKCILFLPHSHRQHHPDFDTSLIKKTLFKTSLWLFMIILTELIVNYEYQNVHVSFNNGIMEVGLGLV